MYLFYHLFHDLFSIKNRNVPTAEQWPCVFFHPYIAQKGILHLSPDVYQEMEASRNKGVPGAHGNYLTPKDIGQGSTGPFYTPSVGNTATIARELLLSGTSPTAEALILKGKAPALACGSIQPSQQLEYLAHIQGFQVWNKWSDFTHLFISRARSLLLALPREPDLKFHNISRGA